MQSSYNVKSIAFTNENNDEFVDYIKKMLQRYKGKIKEIQYGNEWQEKWHYSGSKEEFTETQNRFYKTIKNIDDSVDLPSGLDYRQKSKISC